MAAFFQVGVRRKMRLLHETGSKRAQEKKYRFGRCFPMRFLCFGSCFPSGCSGRRRCQSGSGICGVSDVLDGWLARRWDAVTHTGQLLDSVEDVGFFLAILICFFSQWQSWTQYWVLAILFIRVFCAAFKCVPVSHCPDFYTVLNKITGLLLFLFPVLYGLFGFSVPAVGVCFAASLAALEEVRFCAYKNLTEIAGLFWQSGPEKNGVIPFYGKKPCTNTLPCRMLRQQKLNLQR